MGNRTATAALRPGRGAPARERGELVEAWEVGLGDVILAGRYGTPAKVIGRDANDHRIVLYAVARGLGEVTLIRQQRARVRCALAAAPPRIGGRCRR